MSIRALVFILFILFSPSVSYAVDEPSSVLVVSVNSTINPITSEYIHKNIQRANERLRKRIAGLKRKIRTLEKSNNQLNKTIEMLSTLDSRLEQKRSDFTSLDAADEQ